MAGPSGATSRLALPYPIPDDTADVPRDVRALADKLDLSSPVYAQGNASARPAAGVQGRFYYALDSDVLSYDDGTSWNDAGGSGSAGGGSIAALQSPVLDVGVPNQIRAGRQLTVADFTGMGLSTPVGLFNLSDLTNLGSGGALVNKGAVPFGAGINGAASSCAVFAGATTQALYIADTGAADPFRIRTGSFGAWFRTAKRATQQRVLTKMSAAAGNWAWDLWVTATNLLTTDTSPDGSALAALSGVSDVCDDRWHFGVTTQDGTALRLYVDGVLEATAAGGVIFSAAGPVNIGGYGADSGVVAANPFYGRVDEAFVTHDVLTEDQIRNLYCARLPHTLPSTPTRVSLNVTRRRRGGAFATTDFPAQPLRLHNFTAGATTDQGSNNQALAGSGAPVAVAGADGTPSGAWSYNGASTLYATDAGLPAALTLRSYGCWLKCGTQAASCGVMAWGAAGFTNDARLVIGGAAPIGSIISYSGGDNIPGPFIADGQWHFVVEVEDNAAGDGVKRKLYVDGRLVGGSTVLASLTLGGATFFRLGSNSNGAGFFTGQIDGAFVTGVALTFEQQAALYAKGTEALPPSPKNAGDHVEALRAADVLATFDTLDSTALVDVGVSA